MAAVETATGTRARVLAAIRTAPTPATVNEVADELGLHHNSVRLHAAALQRSGLITRSKRASGGRGRPLMAYQVTSRGARSGERDYELLASVLIAQVCDHDEPVASARRAGHAWGRRLATQRLDADDLVVGTLDDLGFEPRAGLDIIELYNCPFRELVDSHQEVVCAIHAGMLDGLVDGSRIGVDLVPFSSPMTCAVQMVLPPVAAQRDARGRLEP